METRSTELSVIKMIGQSDRGMPDGGTCIPLPEKFNRYKKIW